MKEFISNYFGKRLRNIMLKTDSEIIDNAEEIRIRINKPLIIKCRFEEYFISETGKKDNIENAYKPDYEDIKHIIELISNYSIYAFEEELKQGYITLPKGYRVGITGKTVIEKKEVKTIKNISALNIRIAREVVNCSEKIIKYIAVPDFKHTLIISPPNCGKTTLLRDIIRTVSNGYFNGNKIKSLTVGIADERSEIAGCYMGVAQNDVGIRTDVLDSCPKAEGMIMLLRSMSPDVIAVDEIGNSDDIYAIDSIINSGIKIICTVHGQALDDIKNKPVLNKLINKNIFERFIVLSNRKGAGTVEAIYDNNFLNIFKEELL